MTLGQFTSTTRKSVADDVMQRIEMPRDFDAEAVVADARLLDNAYAAEVSGGASIAAPRITSHLGWFKRTASALS